MDQNSQTADRAQSGSRPLPFHGRVRAPLDSAIRRLARVLPSPSRRSSSHAAALLEVVSDLEQLNRNTERDFLKLGEQLSGYVALVDSLSTDLTNLSGLLSGENGLCTVTALTATLHRSQELNAHLTDGASLLDRMRRDAHALRQTLAGFDEIVSLFGTLGVLTRIETARLGNTGSDFGNLADDMKVLAGTIHARIEGALNSATELLPPIEEVLHAVSVRQQGQARDLPAIISTLLAQLASFHDAQAGAYQSSLRMGRQYDVVADSFRELVVSIQFHDITRQQVEHVADALRKLAAGTEDGRASTEETSAALALQSLQLADAGEKFEASVAAVVENLNRIGDLVLAMAAETSALSGPSGGDQNVFLQIERGCSRILASIGENSRAEDGTRNAAASLVAAASRMHASIDEIQAAEDQMHRLALNAGIRAAHLGANGSALGVLADSMQQRTLESRQRSEALHSALRALDDQAAHLAPPADADAPAGAASDFEQMRDAVSQLHSSGERSFAQIAQIVAHSASLRQELCATRDGFTVGRLFAGAVSRARARLQEISGEPDSDRWHARATASGSALDSLALSYTMQSERNVHAGIGAAAAVADDMGDNVELF